MRRHPLLILSLPLLFLAAAPAPATRPATLTLSLIANKAEYPLPAAQTGKAYRDQLEAARRQGNLPKPPDVDLTLRFTNTTTAPVTIPLGGDDSSLHLKLQGEGAVNLPNEVIMTMDYRMGKQITIKPGDSYDHKITSLAGGARGISEYAYFTEPGEYTLTAQFRRHDDNGKPTFLTSPPVKIKVTKPQ